MTTAKRTDLQRSRMQAALQEVQTIDRTFDVKKKSEYRALVRKFPLMFRSHGMGAALAFLRAKASGKTASESPHQALLDQLHQWLQTHPHPMAPQLVATGNKWIESLMELEMEKSAYQLLRRELSLYLDWLRTITEGIVPPSKS